MIELLVVLALSGIIFSMALLVFSIVQQQTQHQATTQAAVLEWTQLRLRLQQDVQEARQIWRVGEELLLSGGPWNISYRLGAKTITRTMEETHVDTFQVSAVAWNTQWQGLPTIDGLVDQLIIESRFFEQSSTLMVQKTYGSHTILNANESH